MATLKYRDANGNYIAIPAVQGPAGNGISTIQQTTSTSASGGKNVVTVTLNNGATSTFNVYNGAKGDKGDKGDNYGEGIYLPLSGGTLTNSFNLRTAVVKGTAPTESTGRQIQFLESGSGTTSVNRISMIYGYVDASNTSTLRLYAYKSAVGSTDEASLYISYNADGTTEAGSTAPFYGAVWNDYAEFRETKEKIVPGHVVYENGDDTLSQSYKRMMPACSIVSDTYGFAIGQTEHCKTPLAMAGRVLAYPLEDRNSYKPGDAVCSGPDGTVSKMTQEEKINHPECIIGYVSCIPNYEIWGEKNTKVDGRIWIKVV